MVRLKFKSSFKIKRCSSLTSLKRITSNSKILTNFLFIVLLNSLFCDLIKPVNGSMSEALGSMALNSMGMGMDTDTLQKLKKIGGMLFSMSSSLGGSGMTSGLMGSSSSLMGSSSFNLPMWVSVCVSI